MRNVSYIAIVCGVLLAVPGCGRGGKVAAPAPETDTFKDTQYYQSLMGINSDTSFGGWPSHNSPPKRFALQISKLIALASMDSANAYSS